MIFPLWSVIFINILFGYPENWCREKCNSIFIFIINISKSRCTAHRPFKIASLEKITCFHKLWRFSCCFSFGSHFFFFLNIFTFITCWLNNVDWRWDYSQAGWNTKYRVALHHAAIVFSVVFQHFNGILFSTFFAQICIFE